MSVRGVWVIRPSPQEGEVLFSRRFPTVEHRFKKSCNKLYYNIPSDIDLCTEVMLRCTVSTNEFIQERDSIQIPLQWPVFEFFDGKLWPVVCLQKNNLLFVAIVPFDSEGNQRPSLINVTGVPVAISLLTGMSDILGTLTSELTQSSLQIMELSQFLCLSTPFGTPSETNPANIKLQVQFRKANTIPKEKIPSWRPAVYKGPSKIHLILREQIRAVQYDREDMEDVWQVYGSLLCKAELEGHPDVILSLTTPPGPSHLDHLIVHQCVQSADTEPNIVSSAGPDATETRKIRFSAPLDMFTLCHYQSSSCILPIRGFYQMKGDKSIELLVQLKLVENIRNNFEHLEVRIPFFNRGPIEKVDNIHPTTANIVVTRNKRVIVWNVGQKFPTKSLETSLNATVTFVEFPLEEDKDVVINEVGKREIDEKFCVEQNGYCELHFKIQDYNLSGCNVDHRSITMLPPIKYKSSLVRELISSDYKIWNSHGDVLGMPSIDELSISSSS